MTSFPVIYVSDLKRSLSFYSQLGFEEDYRFPEDDDPGYVGMHLTASRLGIVKRDWPEQQLDFTLGESPRFELWVYVQDVDATIAQLSAPVMKPAEDMPWASAWPIWPTRTATQWR